MSYKYKKQEKKMRKAALKLEKITKKFMKELTKVDETMQKLPRQVVSAYMLEEEYFRHIPTVASLSVKLELLAAKVNAYGKDFNEEFIDDLEDLDDLDDLDDPDTHEMFETFRTP